MCEANQELQILSASGLTGKTYFKLHKMQRRVDKHGEIMINVWRVYMSKLGNNLGFMHNHHMEGKAIQIWGTLNLADLMINRRTVSVPPPPTTIPLVGVIRKSFMWFKIPVIMKCGLEWRLQTPWQPRTWGFSAHLHCDTLTVALGWDSALNPWGTGNIWTQIQEELVCQEQGIKVEENNKPTDPGGWISVVLSGVQSV